MLHSFGKHKIKFSVLSALLIASCIEPFNAVFTDFESALVIEATITNEVKQQEILLSRSFEFDADGPISEPNANVRIVDSGGNTFSFSDQGNGLYLSEESFGAQPGVDYQLLVTTSDGRDYNSDQTPLKTGTGIEQITAERIVNNDGQDGMAILVDSFDPSGNSKNYRYEYEETFRVIAPSWQPVKLVPETEFGCTMILVRNNDLAQVCYETNNSNQIIQTSTEDLDEDRVENFMVRFISRQNYIISHRYSILVRQFVQSDEAFNFYSTLKELSSSESLFSQTQPGFLQGNVFSSENSEERVLGFFDVSTVSEQRLFFNYDDFYPGEDLPPYIDPCQTSSPVIANEGGCVLRPIIEIGAGVYAGDSGAEPGSNQGPYLIVRRICGDCSVLGPQEIPEFWIE
ncbi:DUF4249 family protein [Muricauda sp. JGD-17]|uniref:DUF4249 family protein n=1 Tax=Flagellimonas ochracea TaxID=2696472 RepID=A0A964WWI0_9FLAO|nr:DUF4249 domain-containing protein [Allomuricauda ochracea]NAY90817.1 DUF4249 family protein [Allomuricauda ochracea]